MGSNSVQAQGLVLLAIAFILLAGTFASGGNVLLLIGFVVILGASIWRLRTAKPWEDADTKG